MEGSHETHRELIETLYISEGKNFCDLHFHRHIELVYALESGLKITVNGVSRVLAANEVAVMDSFDTHCYPNREQLRNIVLVIPSRFCSDFNSRTKSMGLSDHFIADPDACAEMLQIIRLLQKHSYNIDEKLYLSTHYLPNEEAFIMGALSALLGVVLRVIPLLPQDHQRDDAFKKEILIYSETHYNEPLSLDDMANHFGYSRYYFSKICNKLFGMSINKYINRVRVLKLLEDRSPLSFTALASKHGFSNMRTFQRAFREVTGMTPSEYRQHGTV